MEPLFFAAYSLSPRYWWMYDDGEGWVGSGNAAHIRVRCIGASCGTSRIGEILFRYGAIPPCSRDNAFHA